jgi:hypothetical protein
LARHVEYDDGRGIQVFVKDGKIVAAHVTVKGWSYGDALRVIRGAHVSEDGRRVLAEAFGTHLRQMHPGFDRERFVAHALIGRAIDDL